MINPRMKKADYGRQGLQWAEGIDKPGTIYERTPPHERNLIYTISGELELTVFDTEPPRIVLLVPGEEFVLEEGAETSAVVGLKGWKWLIAWNQAEAAKYDTAH